MNTMAITFLIIKRNIRIFFWSIKEFYWCRDKLFKHTGEMEIVTFRLKTEFLYVNNLNSAVLLMKEFISSRDFSTFGKEMGLISEKEPLYVILLCFPFEIGGVFGTEFL